MITILKGVTSMNMSKGNCIQCDWDGDDAEDKNTKRAIFSSKEDRLYYLYGDINAKNCADIAYDISLINLEDESKEDNEKNFKRKPIKIYFNSFGGSVYDMWLLVDTIMGSKTPVYTYCTGYAMSAAFLIFLAGHKRYMSPHATLMYHQIYCWRHGKYQDLVDDREQTDHLNDMIENYVVERTTLTQKDMLTIREKKKDTYFSAEEAKERCITDEIILFPEATEDSETSDSHITFNSIMFAVSCELHIDYQTIRSNNRNSNTNFARNIVMYLAHTMLGLSYEKIALELNRKDMTMVKNGINTIQRLMDDDSTNRASDKECINKIIKFINS